MLRRISLYFLIFFFSFFYFHIPIFSKSTLNIFFTQTQNLKSLQKSFYNLLHVQLELKNYKVKRVFNSKILKKNILLKLHLSFANYRYRMSIELLDDSNRSFLKKVLFSKKSASKNDTIYSTLYSKNFLHEYKGLNLSFIHFTNIIVDVIDKALKKNKYTFVNNDLLFLVKKNKFVHLDIVFIIQGNSQINPGIRNLGKKLQKTIEIIKNKYSFLKIRFGIISGNSSSILKLTKNIHKIKNYLNSYSSEESFSKLTIENSIQSIDSALTKMNWSIKNDSKRYVFFLSNNNFNHREASNFEKILDFKNFDINSIIPNNTDTPNFSIVLPIKLKYGDIKYSNTFLNENYFFGVFYNHLIHQLAKEDIPTPINLDIQNKLLSLNIRIDLNDSLLELLEKNFIRYIFLSTLEKKGNFFLLKFYVQDLFKDKKNQIVLSLEYPMKNINDIQSLPYDIIYEIKKIFSKEAISKDIFSHAQFLQKFYKFKHLIQISNSSKIPIYFISYDQIDKKTKVIFKSLSKFFKGEFLEIIYYFNIYKNDSTRKREFKFHKGNLFEKTYNNKWNYVSQFQDIQKSYNFIQYSGFITKNTNSNIISIIEKSIFSSPNMYFKELGKKKLSIQLENRIYNLSISKKEYQKILAFKKAHKEFFIATNFSPIPNEKIIPNLRNIILLPNLPYIKNLSITLNKMELDNYFYTNHGLGKDKLWILPVKEISIIH